MKRFLSVLLCAALLLSLCACGSTPASGSTSAPTTSSTPEPTEPAQPAEPELKVGFGRVDLTPELGARGIPLAGYTGTRLGNAILSEEDRVYSTAVAMQDDDGQTLIIITLDLISILDTQAKTIRNRIAEATGIPTEHIQIGCTHTHSGPAVKNLNTTYMSYSKFFIQAVADSAIAAVEDLAPAKLYTGETQVENMNWVRHYNLSDGTIAGDNFGNWGKGLSMLGHTTESDKQMQLIRFVREDEGKKDIVMANWQAHPKLTSTSSTEYGLENRPYISSDYVGYCRSYVEGDADVLFAFYLGAAGNLNPLSNMANEKATCPEETPAYARQLADYVLGAMDSMTEQQSGKVQARQTILEAQPKNSGSPINLELDAVSMGPIAFATVPYEMFDTNGMYVKENSPYETTFMLSLANGSHSYVPSAEVFDYEITAYEVTISEVAKGTGETAAQTLVDMLNDQYGNRVFPA